MTPASMEKWMADRMLRHLEPHMEHVIQNFLRSENGQTVIADVVADLVADVAQPNEGADDIDLLERIVIRVASGLAAGRPAFRRRLLEAVSPV